MGFLDHTTNNIVIDAVLTERGRELLSQNNGSFQVVYFSFGDDEVDYSNILKYGNQIGKEKIEKNTPIFEAQTNENLAIKHNNITLNSNKLRILYVPFLKKYAETNTTAITISASDTTSKFKTIKVLSTLDPSSSQTSIDANLIDTYFYVKMNDLILKPYLNGIESINSYKDLDENNIATYEFEGTTAEDATYESGFALTGRQLFEKQIGVSLTSPKINLSTFQKFGNLVGESYVIKTQIEIIGKSSGSRIIIPVTVTQ
jgi:hypothetical protein